MQGRIHIERAEYSKAVTVLKRVFEQDKEMVSETLPMLETCYTHLDQPAEWAEYLLHCSDENIGAIAELYLADIIEQQEGPEMAITYVNRQLQRHPTMRLFCRLMEYYLSEAEEGRAKESLGLLRNMVGEQIRQNRITAAANADLHHTPCTGTARPAGHGILSSLSEGWTDSDNVTFTRNYLPVLIHQPQVIHS